MMAQFKLLAFLDNAWLQLRRLFRSKRPAVNTAGAGLHGTTIPELEIINGVYWPHFSTLAHSFWRAQEITLFQRKGNFLKGRLIDLGCGDGIFGQLAGFPQTITGVDFDKPSLAIRHELLPQADSIWADAGALPFADQSFDTAVSNSVFEHLSDLGACFREVFRILAPQGHFCFTMTTSVFTQHLESTTGSRDAQFWNNLFGHHQQLDCPEVLQMLRSSGFSISEVVHYQPLKFTIKYRTMASPIFRFFERRNPVKGIQKPAQLAALVAESLSNAETSGACIWVVAKKLP